MSYTHKGRGRSEYIRQDNLAQIRSETANINQFRKLWERWVDLLLESSQLRIKKGEIT